MVSDIKRYQIYVAFIKSVYIVYTGHRGTENITYSRQDKMAAFFQTTFSREFMNETFSIVMNASCKLSPGDKLTS